ncbi:MAG: hypothetical protein MI919_25205 [Holophagales bacterium]|nr:hypothetical protein [Holophagales bacterium]
MSKERARRIGKAPPLSLVATCAVGLEPFVARELRQLGLEPSPAKGAVAFGGTWADVYRANWRLRTANRVLVELGTWNGHDDDALYAGARNLVRRRGKGPLDLGRVLSPERTLAVKASSTGSRLSDTRWIALRVKDGLVDGQRERHGARSSVARDSPDVALRLRLHRNQATLLLDTSGAPLDRRGYRLRTTEAPVREHLAAACVLAAEWDGRGPIVDPMCGSGTLLAEAAWWALGRAPGCLRTAYAFERLPGHRPALWREIRDEPIPRVVDGVRLHGADASAEALDAARANLTAAGLDEEARIRRSDAFTYEPPPGPGLVLVNPPYGERLGRDRDLFRRLGDLLKQRYAGYTAVVLAGGEDLGKSSGLRPRRRWPVRNGPLDARILVFDLYSGSRPS